LLACAQRRDFYETAAVKPRAALFLIVLALFIANLSGQGV
jgi:hypothetical protein